MLSLESSLIRLKVVLMRTNSSRLSSTLSTAEMKLIHHSLICDSSCKLSTLVTTSVTMDPLLPHLARRESSGALSRLFYQSVKPNSTGSKKSFKTIPSSPEEMVTIGRSRTLRIVPFTSAEAVLCRFSLEWHHWLLELLSPSSESIREAIY